MDGAVQNPDAAYAITRNLAYNSQYLEYLFETFRQLDLSPTLLTQTIKTVIVTGVGLFESLFYCVVVRAERNGSTKKRINARTRFADLLKMVQDDRLLGQESLFYEHLNSLKELRHKVHLHKAEFARDTDWNSFNVTNLNLMIRLLKKFVLEEGVVGSQEEARRCFPFLKQFGRI